MTMLLNQRGSHGTWAPWGEKGDDHYRVSVPPGESYDCSTLTVLGQRGSAGARIDAQPAPGQSGTAVIAVHWWYDGGSQIDYRIEAQSTKAGAPSGISVRVPRFLPSTSGFQFSNSSFSERPVVILPTQFGNVDLGKASNGLCGGMVYAVRDYWEARQPIPPGTATPDSGPLFDFIVHRLIDSFDIPAGVAKYLELMNPALPDHETDFSKAGLAPRGRAWRMIVEEWPNRIKPELDAGRPCPLGLVLVTSANVGDLGKNHVVLAYGYDLNGGRLVLHVYNPNAPGKDDLTLELNLTDPEHTQIITLGGQRVYSFFRPPYSFKAPPGYAPSSTLRASLTATCNKRLVCAEDAGTKPLTANRGAVGPWETFDVVIVGSNRIALKATVNGKYVRADTTGRLPLIADQANVTPATTFEISYRPGNAIALKAMANNKYVCAEDAGTKPLIANRDMPAEWETFTLKPLPTQPGHTP